MHKEMSMEMSTSSITSKTTLTKQVRFGRVEIRDMAMELGQHPPTQGGPPINIGWDVVSVRELPVEVYEICKYDEPTRSENELKIDATERTKILLRAGYSIFEITHASEDASNILKQRQESLSSQKIEFFHLARESAQKNLSLALGRGGGSRRKIFNAAA